MGYRVLDARRLQGRRKLVARELGVEPESTRQVVAGAAGLASVIVGAEVPAS